MNMLWGKIWSQQPYNLIHQCRNPTITCNTSLFLIFSLHLVHPFQKKKHHLLLDFNCAFLCNFFVLLIMSRDYLLDLPNIWDIHICRAPMCFALFLHLWIQFNCPFQNRMLFIIDVFFSHLQWKDFKCFVKFHIRTGLFAACSGSTYIQKGFGICWFV